MSKLNQIDPSIQVQRIIKGIINSIDSMSYDELVEELLEDGLSLEDEAKRIKQNLLKTVQQYKQAQQLKQAQDKLDRIKRLLAPDSYYEPIQTCDCDRCHSLTGKATIYCDRCAYTGYFTAKACNNVDCAEHSHKKDCSHGELICPVCYEESEYLENFLRKIREIVEG